MESPGNRFSGSSVRRKLVLAITVTSALVLILASGILVGLDLQTFGHRVRHELETLTEVMAANSAAPLIFDDPAAGLETLEALSSQPNIVEAIVVDTDGTIFAHFHRTDPAAGGKRISSLFSRFYDQLIVVEREIVLDGTSLGRVSITSDSSELDVHITVAALVVLGVMTIAIIVALAISAVANRLISTPLADLANTARQVSDQQDYTLRVERRTNDEIGTLTDAFNDMLQQIEDQRATIQQAHDELELRVDDLQKEIGERKKAEAALRESEEALRQAQKMEAIGHLSGGIAHDFNNLLTAIIGYCDLGLKQVRADDPLRPKMEGIRQAGQRAATLVRQLLAFSSKQILEPRVLNVNSVITDAHNMYQRMVGEDVRISTILEQDISNVRADPGQLEQVLLNLIVNARDAMPLGGSLTISTALVDLPGRFAFPEPKPPKGKYVLLSVADTGSGIDPKIQEKVFDPFFTTKPKGEGTGLGLSTVFGVVKQSGGHILIDSTVGVGSTFQVFLPAVDEREDELQEFDSSAIVLPGDETILLVEDEPQIREMAKEALELYGYTVLLAANGIEAVDIAKNSSEIIDLLLTDVVMPGMNGREVYEAVHTHLPKISVLYMSGHTDRVIVRQGLLEKGIDFIQKPYSTDRLLAKVRRVLDRGENKPNKAADKDSQSESTTPLSDVRVLIAEDNPVNEQIVRAMLDGIVSVVDTAHNGEEVLAALRENSYDIILMDCEMPVMDGKVATRRIRARESEQNEGTKGDRVPIVAVTGNSLPEEQDSCYDAGMDAVLLKPFSVADLIECVSRWTATHRDNRENARPAIDGVGDPPRYEM